MREHADIGQTLLRMVGESGGGLGHLHEAENAFIHARAATAGNDDDRQSLFRRAFDEPCQFFAHDRAHRTAEKTEIHHAQRGPVFADFAQAGDDRVLQRGSFLMRFQLGSVGGHAGETERVRARHFGVHFLERAGFHQRVDPFARADGEMVAALRADLQVFVQFLVENHCAALGTLRPEPLGNVAFFGFAAAHSGLFGQGRRLVGRRRRQCWFDRLETKRFLGKRSRIHEHSNNTKVHGPLSRRKHRPRRRPKARGRRRSSSLRS